MKDFIITESKDRKAELFKDISTVNVIFLLFSRIMDTTINFND